MRRDENPNDHIGKVASFVAAAAAGTEVAVQRTAEEAKWAIITAPLGAFAKPFKWLGRKVARGVGRFFRAGGEQAVENSVMSRARSLWSSTKTKNAAQNASSHFSKHASEFPEYSNVDEFAKGAHDFVHSPPSGSFIKTRSNGDTLFYHPPTNTFVVTDLDGAPRTMFRPDDGLEYWKKQ